MLRSAGAAASAEFRRLAAASAVTSAEIRSRTPSSPGPDVVFNSLAARRRASRRSSRDVVASNSGSGRCWSAIAYSGRQGIDVQYPMSPVPPEEPSPVSGEGSLLPLRHHRLGCDHQRTDRRGVLQCGPHDLGGIDDASLDHVLEPASAIIEAPSPTRPVENLIPRSRHRPRRRFRRSRSRICAALRTISMPTRDRHFLHSSLARTNDARAKATSPPGTMPFLTATHVATSCQTRLLLILPPSGGAVSLPNVGLG